MRISAKIASGYAALILLILAVLFYQVLLIHRMQSINQNLGGLNFRAALLSLQLLRDLDQVEEFTRKLFATGGDPGYAGQVVEMRGAFAESLQEIQALALSAQEEQEVEPLARLWDQFTEAAAPAFPSPSDRQAEEALASQLTLLSNVRVQTQAVIRATRLAIELQVEESARAGLRAERISIASALLAVVVSVLVSTWVVRSISKPLRRLTEGTRAVADGDFSYRLEATGEDELAQLARDFNLMTHRLTELDQMKKDFVSHASHELKTPLASMQETIRLLLDEIPGPLSEQQRRLLELNLQSGRRLSTLIGNLLDLSRMEAGVMEYSLQRQDLGALVRTAAAEFELSMREKHLRLEAQLPERALWVDCDGDRMIQVLDNLLGNALKFAPSGSTVRLCLRHESEMPAGVPASCRHRFAKFPKDSGFALILVSDAGPGVPAEEKEGIFGKFYQVKRLKKLAGQGAGLGLAISRTIVEAHGGAIWAEDNPGGGSIFCVLLCAGAATPQRASRASAPI